MLQIVEVGPRDGLQNAGPVLPASVRAELCVRLAAAGLRRIEAVSFVSAERVPQMAEPEAVVAGAVDCGAELEGLVLNARGAARLRASGMRRTRFALAASDAFQRRNAGVSAEDGVRAACDAIEGARADGGFAGVVLATAFGCPFQGEVDPGSVAAIAARLAAAGADEVVLADTIGVATPRRVGALVARLGDLGVPVGVHLHDTRATGFANAYAAIDAGTTILDAAVGGLGGCPFAPGATGNIATEDLVWMLRRDGIDCGAIDADHLAGTTGWLADLTGLDPPGRRRRVPPFPAPTPAAI